MNKAMRKEMLKPSVTNSMNLDNVAENAWRTDVRLDRACKFLKAVVCEATPREILLLAR